MILRNYDNIMAAKQLGVISSSLMSTDTTAFGNGHINTKNSSGVICPIYNEDDWYNLSFARIVEAENSYKVDGSYNSHIICGSGSNAETYDDYQLASIFATTQVTPVSNSLKEERVYNDDGTWTKTYSVTFANLSGEELKVREIGVVAAAPASYNDGAAGRLVYRKVLDRDISVPANANFILSFAITLSANPSYDATANVE